MSHRKPAAAAMLLLAVAACTNPTGKTPTTTTGSTGPTVIRKTPVPAKTPATDPTATPTAKPVNLPPTYATPTPVATATKPGEPTYIDLAGTNNPNNKTTLKGVVYDGNGELIQRGPNITVRTEGGQEKQVNVEDGKYVIDDLAGYTGKVAITADQYGSTPRTQYLRLKSGSDYVLNFGEKDTDTQVYALNDPPEIVKVEPNQYTPGADPAKFSVTVTVSEALNEIARDALRTAIRLIPVSAEATGKDPAPDYSALTAEDVLKPIDAALGDSPYDVYFFKWGVDAGKPVPVAHKFYELGSTSGLDPAQRVFTLNFDASYLNGPTGARYQMVLVSDPEHPIKDVTNNLLGTDATAKLNTAPPAGKIINNAFLSPFLNAQTFKKETPESRWDSTHVNAIAFNLKGDTTPPTLIDLDCNVRPKEKVDVINQDGTVSNIEKEARTVIRLKFSEALVVPGPGGAARRESITDIKNYSFAVGLNTTYLSQSALLSGGLKNPQDPVIDLKSTDTGFGSKGEVLGKEFRIVPSGTDDVKVELIDTRNIQITVFNPQLFDFKQNAKSIMARVAGIHDPANNVVPNAVADLINNQARVDIKVEPSFLNP